MGKEQQNLECEILDRYFENLGRNKPLNDGCRTEQIQNIIFGNKERAIVSDSRLIRRIARLRKIEAYSYTVLLKKAKTFLAYRDAFYILAKKNVPVYFYNRVGRKKDGFEYSDTANDRMLNARSFPKMYQDIEKYTVDFSELFGEKYSEEYVQSVGKIPQVVKIGNLYCHEDCRSEYINVVGGKRITVGQPENYSRTLHIYGRCGAFGYAVEDSENIPSLIQKKLNENGLADIRVVNHGLWGGEDQLLDHNFLFEAQKYKEGDIVLFYRFHFDKEIIRWLEKYGLWYEEITEEWHTYPEARWCFYDKPGHMNSVGYGIVAEIIVNDLLRKELKVKPTDFDSLPEIGKQDLDAYIAENSDIDFDKSIKEFTDSIADKNRDSQGKNNGAIVMNCNPFTLGHRYLIEYAAEKVEWLYVFVVEEDRSFFRFEDRFRMVVEGTKDLDNVVVVPSGNFIISSYTFPEYFMKDYVKQKNFDVSNDVRVFGEYIAPALSIKTRFAGEEPTDPVTANYNETMERILPEYGIKFDEIPRAKLNESQIISATEVRNLLGKKDYDSIHQYVPDSTYSILEEKYFLR